MLIRRPVARWFALADLVLGVILLQQGVSYLFAITGVEVVGPGDPEYRQATDVTCGPASLRFVLKEKFGQDVSEGRIAELAQTSSSGTTLFGLKQAAASLGHEAQAWRWPRKGFTHVPPSAIIYIPRWDHFAVLVEASDIHVLVFDPLRGVLKFTPRAFQLFWDGTVLDVR